jgi:KRAB domain-containing zinc finger protein
MDLFKKHECEACGKKLKKIEELMQHKQVIHGKDLLYECKQCNVSFTGMEQMRNHAKKFHSYNKLKEQQKKGKFSWLIF